MHNLCTFHHLVNALEDVYGTLGHFAKIKVASKMVDSRFIMEMPYFFPDLHYFFLFFFFFEFLEAQTLICQQNG